MMDTGTISKEHARILKGPHQISYDITNRCNFRCLHCYNASGENCFIDEEMTDAQVISFMYDIASMELINLCFCGGEPLLRKELICESAQILRKGGIWHISLVTNGYLLNEKMAEDLVASGVNRFQVSMDGADAQTHQRLRQMPGSFDKTLDAVKLFKKAGADNIDVAFCPTGFNIDQIEDVCHMCKELGVNGIRVQPLMLSGRAVKNVDSLMPSQTQYRKLVKTLHELRNKGVLSKVEWGDPIDHLIRFRTTSPECNNFVCIKANGSIAPSPYLQLSVGNVKRHKLSEYWDRGLSRIWQYEGVRNFPKRISSIPDFNKESAGIPEIWKDKDIEIDIIDMPNLISGS